MWCLANKTVSRGVKTRFEGWNKPDQSSEVDNPALPDTRLEFWGRYLLAGRVIGVLRVSINQSVPLSEHLAST